MRRKRVDLHILLLTDNFPPESNAPASREFEHAREWTRTGTKVTVITCAPNFPYGKIMEGYKNAWYQSEIIDGIHVIRVKTYMTANKGVIKRSLDFVSFMAMASIAGLFIKKPTIILATSPQFFTLFSGVWLKWVRRVPLVIEIRDLWPDSILAVDAIRSKLLIHILEYMEKFAYRQANHIIAVSNSIAKEISRRVQDKDNVDVITNGIRRDKFRPFVGKNASLAKELGLEDKFVATYIGTIGMAHGLSLLVDTALKLIEYDHIHILIIGGGARSKDLEEYIENAGKPRNLTLVPLQSRDIIESFWSLADVSLVVLKDDPLFAGVIPSKIFESIGMGVPLILSMPKGDAYELVVDQGVGMWVSPESPSELAGAIINVSKDLAQLTQMKTIANKISPNYDRKNLAKEMKEILAKVLAKASK